MRQGIPIWHWGYVVEYSDVIHCTKCLLPGCWVESGMKTVEPKESISAFPNALDILVLFFFVL